jgi:predicted ester cyclase
MHSVVLGIYDRRRPDRCCRKGAGIVSAEENIAIACRFCAEQDRRKGPLPEELAAPGYTAHIPGFPPMDLAGHSDLARAFYGAFPDMTQTIDDALASDEKAALRFTMTGTHQGELVGLAPTGKAISVAGMAIFRIANGRVAELHEVFDQMGLMHQIGAIPSE